MKTAITQSRPIIHDLGEVSFPQVTCTHLSNGIPVYTLVGGNQPILKIELTMQAGRPHEEKRLVATSYASLLKEGCSQYNSLQIAELFDHLGASLSTPFSFDHVSVQAHTLTKHAELVIPVLAELVKEPVFPDSELELFKKRVKQRLSVDLTQNEIVAYRMATELIFGPEHPYGYNSNAALYDEVTRSDLQMHHRRSAGPQRMCVFVAGQPSSKVMPLLEEHFGRWEKPTDPILTSLPRDYPAPTTVRDSLSRSQTAIRLGRRLFNSQDPDYVPMVLLVTILGGYFGSRLMKNLREERGYTYGIHASLEDLMYDGYLSINLETDKKHHQACIQEIHREIGLLQQQFVSEKELKMVKTYLCGHLLSKMDGPIQAMGVIRKGILHAEDTSFINTFIQRLMRVDQDRLREVANRYLNIEAFTTVILH